MDFGGHDDNTGRDGSRATDPPTRRPGPYEASLSEGRERAELAVKRKQRRHRRLRMILGAGSAVAVLGVAAVGYQFLRGGGGPGSNRASGVVPVVETAHLVAPSCAKPADLTIATPVAMAPALAAVLKAFQTQPDVPCATFTVEPRAASAVAQSLAGPVRPDAWIIDSKLWLEQANARAGLGLVADDPFASSPVVVAMSEEAAKDAGEVGWDGLASAESALVLDDPTRSTVGLLSLAAAGEAWPEPALGAIAKASTAIPAGSSALAAVASPEHDVVAPVTQAELKAYNTANPQAHLSGVTPAGPVASLEYSLVGVADGTVASRVLRSLRDFLGSNAARDIVASHGFDTAGGAKNAMPQPNFAAAESLRDAWSAQVPAPRAVLALDTSASTLTRMDGETILSRLAVAAQHGLAELPDRSEVSVWLFSRHLGPKAEDYRALVSSATLQHPAQIQAIANGLESMPKLAGGGRGLYDTIIAATQAASSQSAPGRPVTAVVVTAGPNNDDFGASLGAAKNALAAVAAKDKQVRLVIVGAGKNADTHATILKEIAATTGGAYLPASSGEELTEAIAKGLQGNA